MYFLTTRSDNAATSSHVHLPITLHHNPPTFRFPQVPYQLQVRTLSHTTYLPDSLTQSFHASFLSLFLLICNTIRLSIFVLLARFRHANLMYDL